MKNRMKELRARHSLTQENLAELVCVTRQTILAIEAGKYSPSLDLGFMIARALQSKIDEVFLFESGEK